MLHQYFLRSGKLVAEGELRPLHDAHLPETSSLYYCQACGEVYCTIILAELPSGKSRPFIAYAMTCEKCPAADCLRLPGSIWRGWDWRFIHSLPREILQRELWIHLNHFELGEPE